MLPLVLRHDRRQLLEIGIGVGQVADQDDVGMLDPVTPHEPPRQHEPRRDHRPPANDGDHGYSQAFPALKSVEPALEAFDGRRGRQRLVRGIREDDEPEVAAPGPG